MPPAGSQRALRIAIHGVRSRTRLATSIASSTEMRMPKKTSAFTNHVVPNKRANCTTLFVSSSKNAAPIKNRSSYPRISPSGPAANRMAGQHTSKIRPMVQR